MAAFGLPLRLNMSSAIPTLVEMVQELSRVHEPERVLPLVVHGLRKAYGPRAYVSVAVEGLPEGEYQILRFLSFDGVELIESGELGLKPHETHRGGFIGELAADAEPKILLDLEINSDVVLGTHLREYHSALAIPMYDDGRVVGWTLLFHRDPRGFTVTDLEHGILRANLVGATLRSIAMAKELRLVHEKVEEQIHQISELQKDLLPTDMPDIPGLELAASYEAFDRAGGDYYDFLPLRRSGDGSPDQSGPWGLLIADASGHGLAAAMMVAMLHAIVHSHAHDVVSASGFLEYLNQRLFTRRVGATFVTAFFAIYDPADRSIRYASAGHPPPLLRTFGENAEARFLDDVGGTPLGVFDVIGSREGHAILEPGQTLILYTDGISEAISPTGEMFGMRRIEESLVSCNGAPACVIQSVNNALRTHEGGQHPRDDQTLLALRIR